MYEENNLWYAVFDEEQHDDFPVKAGTERDEQNVSGHTITTYELHENSAVEGSAHLAAVTKGTSAIGGLRAVAKTRLGAYAAMVMVLDERVM